MYERSEIRAEQSSLWLWALGAGFILIVLYFVVSNETFQNVVYSSLGVGSMLAILLGIRINKPSARLGWYFVAMSSGCFALADALSDFQISTLHQGVNSVSYADVFYLAGYPLLFRGVARITRQETGASRREERADSGIVALGAFALLWQLLMSPYLHDSLTSNLDKLVNLAYPVMDVVLIYIVARTLLLSRRRSVHLRLLMTAMITMFASDFIYDLLVLHGRYTPGNGVDALFLAEYVLIGVAALHPSMIDGPPTDAGDNAKSAYFRNQAPLVVVAGLTPPVTLIIAEIVGAPVNVVVLSSIFIAIFLVSGFRLGWLISRISAQSTQLEKSLRELKDSYQQRDDLEANLWHQALHDPLTGLANRSLLEDRLALARARVVRQGGTAAVLMLDLDDFKDVNDTQGHLVGDQLLIAITRRLAAVTRASDTLCRFGGDEFVYLAEGLDTREEIEELGARMLRQFIEPFAIGELLLEQHASIGIVICDQESNHDVDYIRDADAAMYMAKKQRAGSYVVFTPDMRERAVSDFSLVQDLRNALARGSLSMHYQPIVDLRTMEIVGFEALMRWLHPERGWVSPDVFIPLAEKSDLIFDLGRFALREAMATASTWTHIATPSRRLFVAVNLSARQFHDANTLDLIQSILEEYVFEPGHLVVEVTEYTALLDTTETVKVIARLASMGVDLALDDFGTGYSSLSHLTMLRPAYIKVDRSFISPAMPSSQNDTLLEAIVSLGHKLSISLLAEGVETRGQFQRLRALGCEFAQGYVVSPALPANELAQLFDRSFVEMLEVIV
ncbi:MAG: bifunctional diguanylate cyclase/phosphodiesterase [Acidobacteria bacterium]|nr:bifunctional diguanylate cyclase/phosphodiesterase [Acidobacteriota bacterium]